MEKEGDVLADLLEHATNSRSVPAHDSSVAFAKTKSL